MVHLENSKLCFVLEYLICFIFLGAFEKMRKIIINFIMCIGLSAWKN